MYNKMDFRFNNIDSYNERQTATQYQDIDEKIKLFDRFNFVYFPVKVDFNIEEKTKKIKVCLLVGRIYKNL